MPPYVSSWRGVIVGCFLTTKPFSAALIFSIEAMQKLIFCQSVNCND